MSKFAKDIKVNNIIWTISGGDKPQLLPLIVININVRKLLWTGYYDLTLCLPDGSEKIISLFVTMTGCAYISEHDVNANEKSTHINKTNFFITYCFINKYYFECMQSRKLT